METSTGARAHKQAPAPTTPSATSTVFTRDEIAAMRVPPPPQISKKVADFYGEEPVEVGAAASKAVTFGLQAKLPVSEYVAAGAHELGFALVDVPGTNLDCLLYAVELGLTCQMNKSQLPVVKAVTNLARTLSANDGTEASKSEANLRCGAVTHGKAVLQNIVDTAVDLENNPANHAVEKGFLDLSLLSLALPGIEFAVLSDTKSGAKGAQRFEHGFGLVATVSSPRTRAMRAEGKRTNVAPLFLHDAHFYTLKLLKDMPLLQPGEYKKIITPLAQPGKQGRTAALAVINAELEAAAAIKDKAQTVLPTDGSTLLSSLPASFKKGDAAFTALKSCMSCHKPFFTPSSNPGHSCPACTSPGDTTAAAAARERGAMATAEGRGARGKSDKPKDTAARTPPSPPAPPDTTTAGGAPPGTDKPAAATTMAAGVRKCGFKPAGSTTFPCNNDAVDVVGRCAKHKTMPPGRVELRPPEAPAQGDGAVAAPAPAAGTGTGGAAAGGRRPSRNKACAADAPAAGAGAAAAAGAGAAAAAVPEPTTTTA
jgi:hypothetical protein